MTRTPPSAELAAQEAWRTMPSNDTLVTCLAAILAIGLVLYLARAIGRLAVRRGRNFYTWAAAALVFPVPAVVILLILPNIAPPDIGRAVRHF